MQKIVINTSFGKFCFSASEPKFNRCVMSIVRDDENLIRVVEELKERANGHSASLRIVSIPDEVAWQISTEDGIEHVSEAHRTWR